MMNECSFKEFTSHITFQFLFCKHRTICNKTLVIKNRLLKNKHHKGLFKYLFYMDGTNMKRVVKLALK